MLRAVRPRREAFSQRQPPTERNEFAPLSRLGQGFWGIGMKGWSIPHRGGLRIAGNFVARAGQRHNLRDATATVEDL